MAIAGARLNTHIATSSTRVRVRNIVTYRKASKTSDNDDYGIRLITSKLSTPSVWWILKINTSPKNQLWKSLLGFFKVDPLDKKSRDKVINALASYDIITLAGANDTNTMRITSVEKATDELEPFYVSEYPESLSSWMHDIIDAIVLKSPDELMLLNERLYKSGPAKTEEEKSIALLEELNCSTINIEAGL